MRYGEVIGIRHEKMANGEYQTYWLKHNGLPEPVQTLKEERRERLVKYPRPHKPKKHPERTWRGKWFADRELQKLFFDSFREMRKFANKWGYGLQHFEDIKRHKRLEGE